MIAETNTTTNDLWPAEEMILYKKTLTETLTKITLTGELKGGARLMLEGTCSVRFFWVPDNSKINRFGSVPFGSDNYCSRFDAVQPAFLRTRRGSVRFGSIRFRVRFQPTPELSDSVRFGRLDSVSPFFLPHDINANNKQYCFYYYHYLCFCTEPQGLAFLCGLGLS